jgi:hypothetical protein
MEQLNSNRGTVFSVRSVLNGISNTFSESDRSAAQESEELS